MAGGVAAGRPGSDAGREFDVAFERLEFSGGDVRIQHIHRGLVTLLAILGCGIHVWLAQPEVGLLPCVAHDRVRIGRPAVRQQPANVIPVHVSDVDFVNLLGAIPGCLEIPQ
jgi:hypothetical protein